jgi:cell division protein FtsW (lipid II flippase)
MTLIRSGMISWRRWSSQALEDRAPSRDRRESLLLGLVAIFIISNAAALSLVRDSALTWSHLYAPLVWLVVIALAHLLLRLFRPGRDPFILPIFALLTGFGLLLQDRLAPNFLGRQTLWFTLSTAALLIIAIVPQTLMPLRRYRYVLLLGGLLLLAITLVFGVNPSGSGAALWLPVPFPFVGQAYFQPSELLKLLLVIFLASYFTEQAPLYHYRKRIAQSSEGRPKVTLRTFFRQLPFLGPLLLMWGFTLLLLVWQQDLGAAALFFIVFVVMLYLATGQKAYLRSGLALLLLAGIIAFFAFDTVVAGRIRSWLNPWPNASDRAYQIVQALYAQAAGGVFGQGIGQGFPDYIPVVHSDFALAAVAEEWGLVGSLTIIACFAVLAIRGLRVAVQATRGDQGQLFYAYLAAGLVTLLTVQSLLIMGGISRLLPLTGITLPFVSYGGSSLLVSSMAIGFLLFLSAKTPRTSFAASHDEELGQRIQSLAAFVLTLFLVVALTFFYWSVIRAGPLLARSDNPRPVELEHRVQRGRILDRNGVVLAESDGPTDDLERVYPLPDAGPAVGYYSARFGRAGMENSDDAILRGQTDSYWRTTLSHLLHEPPIGGDVRMTLDADRQQTAADLMSGQRGALILLELTELGGNSVAEVRAMVSQPGYDPNRINEQFETLTTDGDTPLFNRATQALYQPGLILQPILAAAAVDSGLITLDTPVMDPHQPITLDGHVLRCVTPRDEVAGVYTWADMMAMRCPRPVLDLGEALGAATLDEIFARFGLKETPQLPIPAESITSAVEDPAMAAIGQENLTVTPLQVALAMAVLVEGRLPAPRLVEGTRVNGGEWSVEAPPTSNAARPIISPAVGEAVAGAWPVDANVSEFSIAALSGPAGSQNLWYVGMAPSSNPQYVVIILLEDVNSSTIAEHIGRRLLSEVP